MGVGNSSPSNGVDDETTILPIPSNGSSKLSSHVQTAPLNWKNILATVSRRRKSLGTATCVLDMGSCTASVGLGGIDAGVHGSKSALPISFPAIALNDLVGDQIGSDTVRSIHPVSSISMPILHANETGEFSYCSPIWKYALSKVDESAFSGKKKTHSHTSGELAPHMIDRDFSHAASSVVHPSHLTPSLQAAHDAIEAALASSSDECEEGGTILICDQLLGSKVEMAKKRAKVARILFALQPSSSRLKLAFCNESFLSLLNSGKTTGVVVHVGFSRSTCAIFVNGRIQNLSSLPTRMVGGHIHSRIMLQALFSRRQFQPAVADMFAVIPLLKETCYVPEDTASEQLKPREVTHVEVTITDKKLTIGHERFTSSDVFFLYGFPAMVVEALQSSPVWPVLQKSLTTTHMTLTQPEATIKQSQLDHPPQQRPSESESTSTSPVQAYSTSSRSSSSSIHPTSTPSDDVQSARSQPLIEHSQLSLQATYSHLNQLTASEAAAIEAQQQRHSASFSSSSTPASSSSSVTSSDDLVTPSHTDPFLSPSPETTRPSKPLPAPSQPSATSSSSSSSSSSSMSQFPVGSALLTTGTVQTVNEEDEPHQLIKTLLQSIVLSGRSTSIRGFAKRFERDLNAILKPNTPAKVHENHSESTWLGGSVLCSLSTFPALSITREEFVQDGINAILRHMEI